MRPFKHSLVQTAEDDGHHDHDPTGMEGTNKGDSIVGGGGPQIIAAGNGADVVRAGGGPDVVHGGNGKDMLYGQGGPDVLDGGNGPDLLSGGCGPDVLTGGRGPDVFLYASPGDAPARGGGEEHDGHDGHDGGGQGGGHDDGGECAGADGVETITDFQVDVDTIDFSQLAVYGFAASAEAHAVWVEQEGDDAVVRVDIDGYLAGGHPADIEIVLAGVDVASLSAGAFIFNDGGLV